jgi:outer membrane murein-binding lipoprotein Lpp
MTFIMTQYTAVYDLLTFIVVSVENKKINHKRTVIKMKKMIFLSMLFVGLLLTGCSEESLKSKSEKFSTEAKTLGETVEIVKDTLKPLEKKHTLSPKDQDLIVSQIDNLTEDINDFKEEEAPLLAKIAKKMAVKELNKKEKELLSIMEKAQNDKAKVADVNRILTILSTDFDMSAVGK